MTDKKKKPEPDEATEVAIDVDVFTIGDLEDYEDATGFNLINVVRSMGESGDMPHPRAMRGLMWLVTRRNDPDCTFESLRDIKVTDLDAALRGASVPSA